jgi:hypothetical protein
MSTIRYYRLDGYKSPSFYVKYKDSSNHILGTLCLDDKGVYYYRTKSQVLSPQENDGTLDSYDAHLTVEEMIDLFEALIDAGIKELPDVTRRLAAVRKGKKVTLERAKPE